MRLFVRGLRPAMPLALALMTLPVLAGCPPEYPKCKDDSTCATHGEVCVGGYCKECRDDSTCKEGFECVGKVCVKGQLTPGKCETDSDCPSGQPCQEGKCASGEKAGSQHSEEATSEEVDAGPSTCELEEVRFDFNDSALVEQARTTLEHNADCIKKTHRAVRVEGNCDERGTEEYNLVLGERRADSVRRYLVNLGVNESAMKTVSYGKERPKDSGHSEAAWAANRRVNFVWR